MVLNWVKNRITLHDAEQEEIDKVFDFLKGEDCEVDFNKIVPMPLELRDSILSYFVIQIISYFSIFSIYFILAIAINTFMCMTIIKVGHYLL